MDLFLPLMLALMVGFLFLSFRNNKKRTQAMADLRAQAVPGARIQLSSGLFGTVASDNGGETIDVEIAPGVVTTWNRLAIREVIADDTAPAEEAPADSDLTDDALADSDDAPRSEADNDTQDK